MKTSLELSRKLKEVGFKHETDAIWAHAALGYYLRFKHNDEANFTFFINSTYEQTVPAYDIIYDLCITHAKEVWGEDDGIDDPFEYSKRTHTEKVLSLLQQGKDPEEYIIENSILFKD